MHVLPQSELTSILGGETIWQSTTPAFFDDSDPFNPGPEEDPLNQMQFDLIAAAMLNLAEQDYFTSIQSNGG